jgi:hypothetical protein
MDRTASEQPQCTNCGGNNLHTGKVTSRYGLRFQPDGVKFWKFTFGVSVMAAVCLDCGLILLNADPSAVRDLLSSK